MKKSTQKLTVATLLAAMALTGCGGNGSSNNGSSANSGSNGGNSSAQSDTKKPEGIKDIVLWETQARELETMNILNSNMATDLDVLTNLQEGLLTITPQGTLAPALAEEWGTEDGGKTWTFKLRQGVKWVDQSGAEKADCTAKDFLTGLEFIMNFHKNGSANTSMPAELIEGALDYYNYTKDLDADEAKALKADEGSKFLEMVGIEAPDDYTLVYTCTTKKPYFDTVATYNCLYPASQALIDELGIDGFLACNEKNMWYNGAYVLESYTQGNEKVYAPNKAYWNKDAELFDSITIKMIESTDVGYQLYQAGDIDQIDLTESNLNMIYNDESHEFHDQLVEKRPRKYSYQIHFNFAKNNEDGTLDTNWNTAVANTAFRQAWYYGLNMVPYYSRTNAINPLKVENNAYTMKGLVYMDDGTEYTAYVENLLGLGESDGEHARKYDPDKAAELKAQAMKELSAEGVTFPVMCDYWIVGGSQTTLDTANVLKQVFKDSFGDDFIQLNIKTYVSSFSKEVRNPRLHSIVINGWGADYGDPQNYLGQETYGEDTAYYSCNYSNINDAEGSDLIELYKEFTKLVNAADKITDDLDARYKAYAEAEAFMIKSALVVPCNYDIAWQLTHVNDYTKVNGMYGIQNNRYQNWETNVDAYTTEQYLKFAGNSNGAVSAQ